MLISSDLDLSGHLLQFDDNELCWLEWSKANEDIHDAEIDVILGGGLFIALDEVGVPWSRALERALPEQVVQKRTDIESNLRPERLVVRLENHPLQSSEKALFQI